MNDGWIKIHRKLTNWEWWDDEKMVKFFLYLLLNANFEEKKWKGILIKRGQLLTSFSRLSLETNFSVRQIRTMIKRLISTHELTHETTSKYSIITICKYDSYQKIETTTDKVSDNQSDNQTTSERQSNDKRATTTKKEKNNKKEEEREENARAPKIEKLISEIGQIQFNLISQNSNLKKMEVARKDLFFDWLTHRNRIREPYRTDYEIETTIKFFATDYTFQELREMLKYSTQNGKNYKNLFPDILPRIQNQKKKNGSNGTNRRKKESWESNWE